MDSSMNGRPITTVYGQAVIVEQAHEKTVFKLPNGVEFHVAFDDENKLKIQMTTESGTPALSIEPVADNALCVTQRMK